MMSLLKASTANITILKPAGSPRGTFIKGRFADFNVNLQFVANCFCICIYE